MCAIFGSFDIQKLKELRDLNAYRGEVSGSISAFFEDDALFYKTYGRIPDDKFESMRLEYPGAYYCAHVQAPTSNVEDEPEFVHPAHYMADIATATDIHNRLSSLWHNGIIKQRELERINKWCGQNYQWDTKMLCEFIDLFGFSVLSDIEGSFACVYAVNDSLGNHNYYIFRNKISPLFVDKQLNISSTKFDGSESIEAGVVYRIDIANRQLIKTQHTFETKETPYFFLG